MLLGLLLIFFGIRGQQHLTDADLGSEDSYQAVYALSGDTDAAWRGMLSGDLDSLGEEERKALDAAAEVLLKESWESRAAGGGERAELACRDNPAAVWKLLYISGLMNGPKVPAGVRKAVTALPGEEQTALRRQLLRCMTDETQDVPETVREAMEGLSGTDRQSMAMQLVITAAGGTGDAVSEHVKALKKSVRDKESQMTAFEMIARGGMSWLWMLMISNSRTVILLGAVLALDVILLALLMAGDRRWKVNIKWIIILAIVDFMLVFQVLPAQQLWEKF